MGVFEMGGRPVLGYSSEEVEGALDVALLLADHRYEREGGEVCVGVLPGDTMIRITFGSYPRPYGTIIPIMRLLVDLTSALIDDIRQRGAVAQVEAWEQGFAP